MNNAVEILPLTKKDIRLAANWYEDKQKGLGLKLTKSVRTTIDFLKINPTAKSVRYRNVRCAVLQNFPFMIHYFYDKSVNKLLILGVFHTSLNPKRWDRK